MRDSGEIRPKLMRYMRKDESLEHPCSDVHLPTDSGGEPLTPEDIAEIIVFAATRRENMVFADSLVFPSHQVCSSARDRLPGLVIQGVFDDLLLQQLVRRILGGFADFCCRLLLP